MKINYKDVMDLGFEREDINDSIFFDQNGYNYFIVNKKLIESTAGETIELEWDSQTKQVTIHRYDSEANRLSKMDILSLKQLKEIVEFYYK